MSVVDPNWVWLITGLYQALLKSLGRVDFIIQSLTHYDEKMFYNTCHNPFYTLKYFIVNFFPDSNILVICRKDHITIPKCFMRLKAANLEE
jgi:hypothetical protein